MIGNLFFSMKKVTHYIFVGVLIFLGFQAKAQFNLKNPILPGFYPDPSIVKVAEDYYLVNSTFAYFPGIPILHSKDLMNWKQIGNAIDRASQMDFLGEQISRGLFAPAINYHKGIFYITCTDIDNQGNFILTAKNPAGPWSNPVVLPQVKGIDPSLFFDDEKAYIIYNSDAPNNKPLYSGHRTVKIFELDIQNLKVLGTETQLVNGGVDLSKKPVWIEGPHIYKREGYYYLLAAEGGTSVNHSQVAFRSKDVKGPYIPYDKNPILTQRGLNPDRKNPITSTGHADLVEGPDGNTYAVFLGVRPYEGDFYNTGRETFIAPVKWTNGWPVINPNFEEVQYNYPVNFKEQKQKSLPLNGNFKQSYKFKNLFKSNYLFLRTPDTSWYKANVKSVTMNLLPQTCMEKGNASFIARRQQHLTFSATVDLNFTAQAENEKAGFISFQNEYHFYYICKSIENGKDVIQVYKGNPNDKKMDLLAQEILDKNQKNIQFKIAADRNTYSLSYATSKNNWQVLKADLDAKFLSTKTAGGFVGTLYALYTTSSGKKSTNKAIFKNLIYSGNDETYK